MYESTGASQSIDIEKISPEALINKRFSLNELLSKNWERNALVDSVKEYLDDFSITNLDQVEDAENPSPDISRLRDETVQLFQDRGLENRDVYIIKDKEGESKLLVTYFIGQDRVLVVGKPATYTNPTERRFPDGLIIEAERMGFVDANGTVFAVDRLVKTGELNDENHTIRLELDPERVDNCLENFDKKSMKPLSLLPSKHGEIGSLLHEIGHLFIYRYISRDSELSKIMEVLNRERNGLTSKNSADRNFSAYEIYSIRMRDERSAWAVGLSILRSLGKSDSLKLDMVGGASVAAIQKRAQDKLSTYDNYYNERLFEHPDDRSIPLASNRARKAARALHKYLGDSGLSYGDISEEIQSDFPPYVDSPVFHLHDPGRILDKLIASLTN